MVDFFYGLPMWLSSLLVLGAALVVGLGCSMGLRKLLRLEPTHEEWEVAKNLMQVVAVYIGIMLAFAGVQVWQAFTDTDAAVSQEAATSAELYRDLHTYGPATLATRNDLKSYVASIVNDEWPQLEHGNASLVTEAALARLFVDFSKIHPQDSRDSAIYTECFSKLNNLVVLRRERIIDSQAGIPGILWAVGLVGSILTVSYASAFSFTRYNILMISGMSLSIGLVFLFILIVDKPFKGQFHVENTELTSLQPVFDRFDRTFTGQPGP
jgi:hypothetical protein